MSDKGIVRFDQLAGFISGTEDGQLVIHQTSECNVFYDVYKSYALVPKNERSMEETVVYVLKMDNSIIPGSFFQGGKSYKMHPIE